MCEAYDPCECAIRYEADLEEAQAHLQAWVDAAKRIAGKRITSPEELTAWFDEADAENDENYERLVEFEERYSQALRNCTGCKLEPAKKSAYHPIVVLHPKENDATTP